MSRLEVLESAGWKEQQSVESLEEEGLCGPSVELGLGPPLIGSQGGS